MKIFKDGKYVKLAPNRYEPIEKIILDVCDIDKKRLSAEERKLLELRLLLHNLRLNDKYVFELIDGHGFKGVEKTVRRESPLEYKALFDNIPKDGLLKVRISSGIALILNGGNSYKTDFLA